MPVRRSRYLLALAGALGIVGLAGLGLPRQAVASTGTASLGGTLQLVGSADFVVQSTGRPRGVMHALVAGANRLAAKDYPYVWGGGHAEAGVASIGSKGPGHNGHRRGFDCSGSVAAVLASANLWPAGGSVPGDSGVIADLRSWHMIARGAGHGAMQVTLYDDPGVHIFMSIAGRFFGTSAGASTGDSKGGPGWIDSQTPDVFTHTYKRYHILASVLRSRVSGQSVAFRPGALQGLVDEFQLSEPISVRYRATQYGTLVAESVAYPGATALTGSVTAIAPDGSSLTVQPASGPSVTLTTGSLSDLMFSDITVGDTVSASYTAADGVDTLRTLISG
jgi:hypothetical protein